MPQQRVGLEMTTVFLRTDLQGNMTVWRNLPDVPEGYTRTETTNRDGEALWMQFDDIGRQVCTYLEVDLL